MIECFNTKETEYLKNYCGGGNGNLIAQPHPIGYNAVPKRFLLNPHITKQSYLR
jgi:hypothetical protein